MALPMRAEQRGYAPNPFEIIRQDLNMLNRLFGGGVFGETGEAGLLAPIGNYGVDIREDSDHIYVEADLPGFRKEDINISLEKGMLTIAAERREEQSVQPQQGQKAQQRTQTEQQDYLLHERQYQRFVRSFTLPASVDEQNVQAKLEDGVLKVALNKRESAKPKRVQVS